MRGEIGGRRGAAISQGPARSRSGAVGAIERNFTIRRNAVLAVLEDDTGHPIAGSAATSNTPAKLWKTARPERRARRVLDARTLRQIGRGRKIRWWRRPPRRAIRHLCLKLLRADGGTPRRNRGLPAQRRLQATNRTTHADAKSSDGIRRAGHRAVGRMARTGIRSVLSRGPLVDGTPTLVLAAPAYNTSASARVL